MNYSLHLQPFSLHATFQSGQCFRFYPYKNGYAGVAGCHPMIVLPDENGFFIHVATKAPEEFVLNYLDAGYDYLAAQEALSAHPYLKEAAEAAKGMRILRQEVFEVIVSFLLSQNNHITRISKLVEAVCKAYGKRVSFEGAEFFAFPAPESLAMASEQELRALGCGYRAPYIAETARLIASGAFSLQALAALPDKEAGLMLQTLPGVGPKVAACILLFGLHRFSAFPVDTWIRKTMRSFCEESATDKAMENYGMACFAERAGLAGQYLFYHARGVFAEKQP